MVGHRVRGLRILSGVLFLGMLGFGLAVHARAESSYVKATVSASPGVAPSGSTVTLIGTVTPVGGTWTAVALRMANFIGTTSCEPSAYCVISTHWVTWTVPTLDAPLTVTADVPMNEYPGGSGGMEVSLSIDACTPDCLVMNYTGFPVKLPTATPTIGYSPAGVVMPGAVLHFTAGASVNAGPVEVNLHTDFPASGLAAPTGLPSGAQWYEGGLRYIDYDVTLNPSAQYSFDAEVTAPIGTDITVSVLVHTGTSPITNPDVTRSLSIHIGLPATKAPPGPSGGTSTPVESASASDTVSPSPPESPEPVSSEGSAAPSASPSAGPAGGGGSGGGSVPPVLLLFGGVVCAGGIAGLALWLWRR